MIRSCSSLFFWLSMTIGASLMLYHTSDRVTALDRQLRKLNTEIEGEEVSLHVLKAEWVYLANPARIEAQVHRHLGLQPTETRRVASIQHMGNLLPLSDSTYSIAQKEVDTPQAVADAGSESRTMAQSDKHDRVFAVLNEGHINDRMVMQHSAAQATSAKKAPIAADVARALAGSSPDGIGALIGTLGLHQ